MNFKSLREDKLKLSQEQFANEYGVKIEDVEKWDESNNEPSIAILQKIAENTGLSLDEIIGYEKPKLEAFKASNTWQTADVTTKNIVEYIKISLDKMGVLEGRNKEYIDDFEQKFHKMLVKPKVSIVGRSDTGKSTLINALLGTEKMPTSWSPTTSIAVYLKHVNDRPDYIKDDVLVFKNKCDNETIWDDKRLHDKEYCEKWKIDSGDISLLEHFATRQGGGLSTNAGSAVVFIDADILLNCDIVDLPGYGTETKSDDEITFKTAQKTDILIYLSQANGFMRIEDINYLKQNVNSLPVWEKKGTNDIKPLANLFVVASQAQSVNNGNVKELNDILSSGCERFTKSLSNGYWDERTKVTNHIYYGEVTRSRFFTFTTDIPKLCKDFISELKTVLEQLPIEIEKAAKTKIDKYSKLRQSTLKNEIANLEKLKEDKVKFVSLLEHLKDNELDRIDKNNKNIKVIKDKICSLEQKSRDDFTNMYNQMLNTDSIVQLMKDKKVKNEKEKLESFVSQLQDDIQVQCQNILTNSTEDLMCDIKNYIENYSENIKTVFGQFDINLDFDAVYSFATAQSVLGFISSIGAAGGVGLGLGVAGLSISMIIGSVVLGPISLSVSLLVATTIFLISIFSDKWMKGVAKKIIENFEKNNLAEKYRQCIVDFWDNVEKEFNFATEKLENDWKEYIKDLQSKVDYEKIDKIDEEIILLTNVKIFFENMPLSK